MRAKQLLKKTYHFEEPPFWHSFFFFCCCCVRSDLISGLLWAYFAYHRGLSRHIGLGPAITSAYLRAATLGANWVYWPRGSAFGQAQRRSSSQATHVSHLDRVFYLLLHRHKIHERKIQKIVTNPKNYDDDTRNHGLLSHSTDVEWRLIIVQCGPGSNPGPAVY
jgi:hypothetical protein